MVYISRNVNRYHCVKSVQIRSFSGPYFPVFSSNTGKYGPEKTLYLDTFHAVYARLLTLFTLRGH